jgi:hypothetical protein
MNRGEYMQKTSRYLDDGMRKSLTTMVETFCFLRRELNEQGLSILQANEIAEHLMAMIFKQASSGNKDISGSATRDKLTQNIQEFMTAILDNATLPGKPS